MEGGLSSPGHFGEEMSEHSGEALLRHIIASVICQVLEWSIYIIPGCMKS